MKYLGRPITDFMNRLILKYWKHAVFTIVGAGLGFAYWKFVGCAGGTCPLTSNWHTSTLFGGLIGMLAVSGDNDKTNKPDKSNKQEK